MKKDIVLIGGGGHCKVIIDAMRKEGKFNIKGIVDAKLPKGSSVLGAKVLGKDRELKDMFKKTKHAFICVGSIGDCSTREKMYSLLKKIGYKLAIVRHPASVIAKDVKIGEGSFIAAGVVINPGTLIGKNTIINTSSSVDHDCVIGDFVHIAPGVTLSGEVSVGKRTHIGTGANIVNNITILADSFILAGSLVSKSRGAIKK